MKTLVRILHIVAITVLLGSAGYAYSVKYETLYYAETLAKTKGKLQREREQIAVAKAEWALLTRPDRLQKMVDKHLDLQPMTISQLGRLADIPARPAKDDEISRKLEALGLETGSIGKAGERPRTARPGDEIGRKMQSLGLDPAPSRPPAHKQLDTKAGAKPLLKPAGKPAQDRKAEAKPASGSGPSHAAKLAQAKVGAPKAEMPKTGAPKAATLKGDAPKGAAPTTLAR